MSDDNVIYSTEFEGEEPIRVEEWACLTYLIYPSEIPGTWVSHCLEVDVVSQGDGPEHALKMVLQATAIIIELDKREGRDPFERQAPDEQWHPERLKHWKKIRAKLGQHATWKGYDLDSESFAPLREVKEE